MPIFKVSVMETRYVDYYVSAISEDEAREQVEASSDADGDFGHRTVDGSYQITNVEAYSSCPKS